VIILPWYNLQVTHIGEFLVGGEGRDDLPEMSQDLIPLLEEEGFGDPTVISQQTLDALKEYGGRLYELVEKRRELDEFVRASQHVASAHTIVEVNHLIDQVSVPVRALIAANIVIQDFEERLNAVENN